MTAYNEADVIRLMNSDRTVPLYVSSRGRPWSPELVEAVRRLATQGLKDREAAARLGNRITVAALERGRLRHGIPSNLPPVPIRHGTSNGYTGRQCRCEECTAAHTERYADYKARKQADGFAGLTHGKHSTYCLGCHCVPCLAAGSAGNRASYLRRLRSRAVLAPSSCGAGLDAPGRPPAPQEPRNNPRSTTS